MCWVSHPVKTRHNLSFADITDLQLFMIGGKGRTDGKGTVWRSTGLMSERKKRSKGWALRRSMKLELEA